MIPLTQLGRYQIETPLGSGAFADVYRASDPMLKRTVALKVLKPALLADKEAFGRFVQEAQVAANLFHPHIATVLDLGEADGRYFIAMRYVDGLSLDKFLTKNGLLAWGQAIEITAQIGQALDFAHQKGLVHRDVKPQNIIISASEGAVLTDFGLVRAIAESGLTHTGSMLGTPAYMAPEIWEGEEAVPATDQYALACVLVEMLTGKVLFDGKTPPAVMAKHFKPLVLPEAWSQGVPAVMNTTLSKVLAKTPAERFENNSVFLGAFREPLSVVSIENISEEKQEEPKKPTNQEAISKPEPIHQEAQGNQNIVLNLGYGVIMEFVRIPVGEFWMGDSEEQASKDEKPYHKVYLDEYLISKYPVTNRQYQVFVHESNHAAPLYWKNGLIPRGLEDHPTVNINWNAAIFFCRWVSQQTGQLINLPSEAQWEKAARGTDQRIYPWGDQKPHPSLCNYDNGGILDTLFYNIRKTTTPIGKYSPQGDSPYGCVDMSGNVWEWCNDLYDANYYRNSPTSNPTGPISGKERIIRGGSWAYSVSYLRSAVRVANSPTNSGNDIGFRCILSS